MEVVLVDNYPFADATRFTSSDTLLKCSVANHNPRTVCGNESHAEYIKKVLTASKGKNYCIHIKKNPADVTDYYNCVVRLHGFFSENFETMWMEGLRVRIMLSLSFHATAGYQVLPTYPLQMFAEIPIPKISATSSATVDSVNERCITNGMFLEATDVSVYKWDYLVLAILGNNPQLRVCATISLLSDSNELYATENDQLAVLNNPARGITRVNRAILDAKLHSDVIISAKDGSWHDCNKAFLAAQSSVLEAMLETDMKESKTNTIEMKDMTSDGVKALLKYLYTFELDQAVEKCDIALELLQAGHKYDVESLEKDVSSLILNKDEDWFSVDMAFDLFLFTRKVDAMKDIKLKAARMLQNKPKEFLECKAIVKKQEENLVEVADATKELFCLAVMK